MTTSVVSSLLDRATDGVDTDEITLTRMGDRYRLSVAGTSYEDLSEEDVRQVLADHEAATQEWAFWHRDAPQSPARRTFLRWVEDADNTAPAERRATLRDGPCEKTWGQLRLSVRLDAEDGRVYEIRHVDDAETPAESLEAYADPLAARDLATFDDEGRYRPLSTAPTLQTSWVFTDLDAEAASRTVNVFYPASIANWYRERQGELDVTHWDEATNRQTGIYAVTSELRGASVNWVAEACCVDSQCVKRREWDAHADRELSVPRGNGAFPCREPCSLVIAAARKWAVLEREEEQTYAFRLTPSEKEQLEGLLDAVANGTTGEIREADVGAPANRYRARFLRAKRTDEDGRLDATDGDEKSEP